ncbi:MAG TPA: hypothetical protein VEB60_00680, partial [Candidatus Paceibacterota bacterium]|nr:hypothetical protein [Candidatus Paceibacterota bacterium]
MRYPLKKKYVALAAVGFVLGWILSDNVIVGLALFAFLLTPAWWDNYLRYAKDNPQRLWFKRKLYGWGWTPVTWQGWLAVLAYAGLVISSVSF